MEPNEKESFWTKIKNTFKKNNYFWTKIASAILAGIIVIILIICLATCNGHNHKYDSAWSSDETNHWHQATCEHDKKKDLAAHSYGDWVTVTEATETTKGSKKRVCSVCSYVDTAEIAVIPHTHSLVHHEAVDATHATKGNIEYWSCSGCGKYFSDAAGTTEIADKTSVEVKYFSKGLEYTLSSDGASYLVSGIGTCTDTDIVIPSTYEGKDVTGITATAFAENESITSVVIPDNITSIEGLAFQQCSNITNAIIGNGITEIKSAFFLSCTNLEWVVLPSTVTSISEMAFDHCDKLEYVYYSGSVTSWANVEVASYHNDPLNTAICYYSETVPTDGDNSYWHYDTTGNIAVWTVYKVAKVEASCTDGHEEYYKSTINEKIYKDEAGTIETTLDDLKITALGHSLVHHEATDPTKDKDGNIEYWSCSVCGKYFIDAAGTTEITKTSVIVKYASEGLAMLYDPNTDSYIVESLGTCTDTDIVIPSTYDDSTHGNKSVTSILAGAFQNKKNIKSVVIPEGVTTIGNNAFEGCSNLEKVEIPSTVITIGEYAFNGGNFPSSTNKISIITIPSGITTIKSNTFRRCANLKEIVLFDSVTTIEYNAFLFSGLEVVYYEGTAEQFAQITVGAVDGGATHNFREATKYYYSETQPTDIANNYWHYVDGIPTKW